MSKRIQLRRKRGWKMPPNTVKVDRSTPWGNPFVTSKHGTQEECVRLFIVLIAGHACLSTNNLKEQLAFLNHFRENLEDLRGKNLACWCQKGTPCHGDVLLHLSNSNGRPNINLDTWFDQYKEEGYE